MVVRGRALWAGSTTVLLGALLHASPASAFCRSRACDFDQPSTIPCKKDRLGCPTNGAELYWPTPSFDMWVDHKGSPKNSISGAELRDVLEQAFATWTSVDCNKAAPSIAVRKIELMEDDSAVAAGLVQPAKASSDDPAVTTSITAFIDEGWMKESADAIALTTTSFGTRSGRIFGADIELDSTDNYHFTLDGDPSPDYDLLAVLTHETGHVLGLADLETPGPTMYGHYDGRGNAGPRSLESDDQEGICTIYPAGRFGSDEGGCGCRLAPSAGSARAPFIGLGLVALGLAGRRRRVRLQRGVKTTPSAPPK